MKDNTIQSRFRESVEYVLSQDNTLTKTKLAEILGCGRTTLSEILSGRMMAGTDIIAQLCKRFSISSDWILLGRNEKRAEDCPTTALSGHLIPFFDDVTTIGGCNTISATVDGCMPPSDYIDAGDWFHEATAAIRHYGDSMIEYPSGCILALKKVEDMRLILWGHNYVVETSEFRITKRLQKGTESNTIVAYSSNTATYPDGRQIHEPKVIPLDTIRSIWLVLGYVVKEFSSGAVFVQK